MILFIFAAALLSASAESKNDPLPTFSGPGRFCGHSAIVDLLPGEKIEVVDPGIHSAGVRWTGAFGSLDLRAVGWAAEPGGAVVGHSTKGHRIFAERRVPRHWEIALWNGRQGAVYFQSPDRFTAVQRTAVERVDLFQEGEEPLGKCSFRVLFAWE